LVGSSQGQRDDQGRDQLGARLDGGCCEIGRCQAAEGAGRGAAGVHLWAAGIVYAVGRVNFLADPAQRPHLRTDQLARLIVVKQTTMANKGRLIMDMLGIGLLDPEYSRSDMLEHNPMVWMLQVDGLIVDAHWLPEELQVQAWQRGLIPYVPAHAAPGGPPTDPSAGPM
jgi:hypothetical protein